LIAAATLAGCQTLPVEEPPPPVVQVEPVAPEPLPVEPEPEPAPPTECELLLDALETATPQMASVEERLAEYTDRIEAATDALRRPPPRPAECPEIRGTAANGKETIGAIEWIYMDPPGRHYRARVDSGAETSSLSAKEVIEFERDGEDWVRFTFDHDRRDDAVSIELPIVRRALIRQVASDEAERRVVVEMDIRLGDRLQTTEFTLTDRSRMTYPVLLGRAFLMDLYVIDVAESYTHPRYEPK
ncbi:MAG: ATP-dependent zinc protease, partial [Pseudomonadota bacterium]